MAQKQASLAVEGELASDGLAGHAGVGDDLTLALARSLADGSDVDEESLEALFAIARKVTDGAEATLELDLVDADEPTAVEADRLDVSEPMQRLVRLEPA